MVFRIEDTDRERSKKEYETDIVESLAWLGIKYDSGPFRQSERSDIYGKYIERLVADGKAYISKEDLSDESNPVGNVGANKRRSEVIRFKNPNKKIRFDDIIRGQIEFDTTELGDFVIARSAEEPLYHLTVVIDDHEMGVTHVIRGEDGISNTPRQILIQEAIGAKRPIYAHLPLILAADKSKLSGRHGAVSVIEYRKMGYIPEALINYLALLGWNPGNDREIFSMDELAQLFSIEKIQKSGAVFDPEKLRWFNREYLSRLSKEDFLEKARDFMPQEVLKDQSVLERILPTIREKIHVFADIAGLFADGGELGFVIREKSYSADMLLWKKDPVKESGREHLSRAALILEGISQSDFNAAEIRSKLWDYAEKNGKGNVLWPLRFALTGQEKSPDPFMSAEILGKEESIKRIVKAVSLLSK